MRKRAIELTPPLQATPKGDIMLSRIALNPKPLKATLYFVCGLDAHGFWLPFAASRTAKGFIGHKS